MFAPLAAERSVTLELSLRGELPPVLADADRVVQALGNLVGNALKFTPEGGRVSVAVERDGADGGRGAGVDGARGIRFRVADTGCGIAPEHLAHVFDRFWQARDARRGGAGLGLAIAKGIVEAHGGTLTVESEPGVGTTFTCSLPALPAA
jgi:signal transduction histidine kinase